MSQQRFFFKLELAMRYDYNYALVREVRRPSGRNIEDNYHGEKMEAREQRRDCTTWA